MDVLYCWLLLPSDLTMTQEVPWRATGCPESLFIWPPVNVDGTVPQTGNSAVGGGSPHPQTPDTLVSIWILCVSPHWTPEQHGKFW